MFEIDEKHRKQMDALALISTCRECGKVGLNKNGTRKSGRNNRLLMYVCGNCNKVYSERVLADLVSGQPDDVENVSIRTKRQEKRPGKQASEKLDTTEKPDLNALWTVYEELGEDAMSQQLHELVVLYENRLSPDGERVRKSDFCYIGQTDHRKMTPGMCKRTAEWPPYKQLSRELHVTVRFTPSLAESGESPLN